MAPLITGSLLLSFIAEHVFNAQQFSSALGEQRWFESIVVFQRALLAPDGILWAYLLFAIANAMMPSASDRQPLRPLFFTSALVLGLYLLFGLPLAPFTLLLNWLATPKAIAVCWFTSMSNLPMVSLPSNSLAISFSTGAIILQGPHHSAQKSTKTGVSDSTTICSNVASVTSTGAAIVLSPLLL
jgi:hypothetical protein